MSDYGFTISINDLSSAKMKQIENSMKSLSSTVKTETSNIESNFSSIADSAKRLTEYLTAAFAVNEIINFGKELLHTAAEFQGFFNVIKYSSMGTVDSAQNIEYLRGAVERLKLPMRETYESFSEMEAGFYGTGIQGEKLRKVFEGVAEASSVLHLNPETFSRVTFALKEVGELGTLQARQLRMLSFSLPGAGNLAAQAMHMNSAQLHEAMKKGLVNSSDFLPKFAEVLTKHFEKGLKNAGESLISQMNVMKNSILDLKLDMGDKLAPLFTHIMDSITDGIRTIKSIWDSLTANSTFVDTLKFLYDWTVKLVPIWIGYKIVMAGWNAVVSLSAMIEGLFTREIIANTAATVSNYGALALSRVEVSGFGASMITTTAATEASTGAMVGLSSALATLGIGAFIVGLGLIIEKFISMNREAQDFADEMTHITKTAQLHKEGSSMYNELSNRYASYGGKGNDPHDRAVLLKDMMEAQKFLQDKQLKVMNPTIDASKKANESANKIIGYSSQNLGTSSGGATQTMRVPIFAENNEIIRNKAKENYEQQVNDQKFLTTQLRNLGKAIADLIKDGIKPAKDDLGGEGGSLKNSAFNTSSLAGASGGLGQARIIKIDFHGPFQQNNGVKESKNQADEAIEKMTELLNNFSDSTNSQ